MCIHSFITSRYSRYTPHLLLEIINPHFWVLRACSIPMLDLFVKPKLAKGVMSKNLHSIREVQLQCLPLCFFLEQARAGSMSTVQRMNINKWIRKALDWGGNSSYPLKNIQTTQSNYKGILIRARNPGPGRPAPRNRTMFTTSVFGRETTVYISQKCRPYSSPSFPL